MSNWVQFDRNGARFVDAKTAFASREVRELIDDFKSIEVNSPPCCEHHEAYDERVAIMALDMDEAQAIQMAMLDYGNKCYGCGLELSSSERMDAMERVIDLNHAAIEKWLQMEREADASPTVGPAYKDIDALLSDIGAGSGG